jgi:hypothetical protein
MVALSEVIITTSVRTDLEEERVEALVNAGTWDFELLEMAWLFWLFEFKVEFGF